MAPIVLPTYIYLLSCVAIPGTSKQIQVHTPVMALHISHVEYVMPMLDGRTGGFVAILAISGITLTDRACPQLCIVS